MRRYLLLFGILAVALVFVAPRALAPLSGADTVPTYEVQRGDFVHRVEAEGVLVAENATPLAAPPTAERPMKIAWLAQDGTNVEEGEVVIRFDPTDMQKELYDGEADRDRALSQVRKRSIEKNTSLDNLERDATIADLQLDHAREFQTTDAEIYSRMEILESQIDETLALKRKEHANESREISDSQGQVEIDLLELERRKAELTIDRARAGLDELEVRAPHAGIFVLTRDRGEPPTVGTIAWPGRAIAEIPQLDVMMAQVYLLEADAGGVEAGVPAEVRLEAHPDDVFAAEVRRISAVAQRRNRWSPVQYFDVDLALPMTDPEKMKPGQRVRATLLVQDLEDVLAIPREAVFRDADNSPYVFVRNGSDWERRDVVLGATALGRAVVEQGLEVGERIALQDPLRDTSEGDHAPADGPPLSPTGSG